MSSIAWGLMIVLFVSAIFGSIRMYVLICIGCVVISLSVSEAYGRRVKVSSCKNDETAESTMSQLDDEVDACSEDVPVSNIPFSSTPSKPAVMQELRISSPQPTVIQSGLIPGYNAEFKHTDSVECKQSADLTTSITTRHSSSLLDDTHVIQDITKSNQNVENIGSHDQRGSHDHKELHDQSKSHDQTDYAKLKPRKSSFRTSNHQKKRQLISQIFFILIVICIVTSFYHNPWVACCLLLPIGCTVIIRRIVLINFVYAWLRRIWLNWKSSSLCNAMFPPLVCYIYNSYAKLDKKVSMLLLYSNFLP